MKLIDIRKIERSELPTEDFKEVFDKLKTDTENFNTDLLELYEDEIEALITVVKKYAPTAIKTRAVRKAPVRKPKQPVIDFEADDVVEQVMKDYDLTRDKAIRLIALRKEAIELKKENLEKLLDRLEKSEFYEGKLSKSSIDKGRSRDLGKDSKQGSITLAEEREMTGRPFKRISKAGAKNQYGTSEGGKVYYEYRMNRRDVDNKIRLKEGGSVAIPNADKMFHLPYEIAVYVPSTKDVDKTISATELRARVKEVEKYLAETFGGFTSSEKVGGYLSSKSSVITEKVIPVTAFCSLQDFTKNKAKLVNKMSIWAKMWGQEAIGFEFEGDLYYVPQKFKTGGKLKATYIPKSDIKMLTTVWGNNIKGKDLLDGAYTKRKNIKKAPQMSRTMFEEETYEYKEGGSVETTNGNLAEMKKIIRSKLPNEDFKNLYDALKRETDNFNAENTEFFADQISEFLRKLSYKSYTTQLVQSKDFMLTDVELPIAIYTYLPNIRYGLNKEYKENVKSLSMDKILEYMDTAQRLLIDGKFYYGVGYNQSGRGYAVNLQNAFRCKKYLEKLKYKVAVSQSIFRFDPEKPVSAQDDFYDIYTDKILPTYIYNDLESMGIYNPSLPSYKKGGKTKEPIVVRGFYDDEAYEYAKGGKTPPKPKMVRYFFEEEEQEYAKGGMTQHGLKRGDTIVDDMFWENKIVIRGADGQMGIVDLETGIRK